MIRGERFVAADPGAVAEEAARRFVAAARQAVAARGHFTCALAGGSTPKALYERLAAPPHRDHVDWRRVEVCFGDERCVPPEHPDSNYGLARRALLDVVAAPPDRIHRIEGEHADGAARYEAKLRALFGAHAPFPVFDLILLGLGADGHTASLFPHTPALAERTRWVVRQRVAKLDADRITLTAPVLSHARQVLVTACGVEKAAVLRALATQPEDPAAHPILLVRPSGGGPTWLLDRAAASGLPPSLPAPLDEVD